MVESGRKEPVFRGCRPRIEALGGRLRIESEKWWQALGLAAGRAGVIRIALAEGSTTSTGGDFDPA